jgi:signal transduction histidine kinase
VQGVWHELGAAEYGGRARMLVVADVTADAAIRRRLREHNRALAELVAARTELVTALLHELRSPLTSMSAMLDLLPGPTGQADVDAVLDVVVRNTGRLNAAVEEMATISGLETNTVDLDLADVDVAALVETAVTRWKDDVRVTADVTGGPPLQGDPGWLAELVDRLIAVAVTTAPPRSTVTVQAAPDDDGWRLAVPVTSDQTADRLFTSAQGRGTATALMLARAVVARHNGTLRVVPGPDASAMVVRLPYRQKLLGANAARLDGPGRAGPAPGRAGRAG